MSELTLASWSEHTGEEFSDEIVLAASYLQARGYRFCIEFGYQNAVAKAEDEYAAQWNLENVRAKKQRNWRRHY